MPTKRTAKNKAKPQSATPTRGRELWHKAFLSALRVHGNVSVACHVCEIDRSTAYRHRNSNKDFELAWDEAMDEAGDWLEHEARRRAEEGTLKPVYYKGDLVGFEREFSDTLMAMMLKGTKPDKYGDKLTIKINPEHLAVLKRYGLTASEAFEQMIQDLANADANK